MTRTTKFQLVLIVSLLLSLSTGIRAEENNNTDEPITKTLVWPDGTRYVGGVADGKRTGKGTIFWQDGTRFVGQFENDMRNGPGTMILPDGTVYTGFFKNDELVDTEATIAASNAGESIALDAADTASALGDTELPMEADSLTSEPEAPISQVDEYDLIEPTRVAAAPAEEAAPVAAVAPVATAAVESAAVDTAAVETAAVDTAAVDTAAAQPSSEDYSLDDPYATDVTEITDSVKDELIETIDLWAAAWSDQNVTQYLTNYSQDFAVPGRQSRRTWEALRRTRLTRPSFINLGVDYQRFELVETNIVDVFFRQSYRSNSYSDLTDKVLRMQKEDQDWKILVERSR